MTSRPHDLLEGAGLVVDMSHLEQGLAVSGHEHGPAGEQPGEHAQLTVGQGVVGPDHHRERHRRGGEPAVGVGSEQPVLAQQLVQAVLVLVRPPVVGEVLGDREDVGGGVGDRGAGEHVVAGPAASEQLEHDLDVLGVVGGDVVHAVPLGAAKYFAEPIVVGAVGDEPSHRAREIRLGPAPVADGDVVTGPDQLVPRGRAR